MLLFAVVALVNAAALAFLRYGGVLPLPTELLGSRVVGAAANAVAEELQFRSIVLGMLIFAGAAESAWRDRHPGAPLRPCPPAPVARARLVLPRWLGDPGLAAGARDRRDGLCHSCDRRPLRGDDVALRLRRGPPAPATDLRPMPAALRASAHPAGRVGRLSAAAVSPGSHHLYVHVPFCRLLCAYCDFVTVGGRSAEMARYMDGLLSELAGRPRRDCSRRSISVEGRRR